MAQNPEKLKAKCLCIDIETSRKDQLSLREIGAYRPDTDARLRIKATAADFIAQIESITAGAAFLLGHNIIAFDQPTLSMLHPNLSLHDLPLVDTLELSPLAFPQNPYHRLVKDYKLCTTTQNNPLRDAELAYALFLDQHQTFLHRLAETPDEVLCLHFLMAPENGKGVANFFAALRRDLRPSLSQTAAAWQRMTQGKVCIIGQQRVLETYLADPAWHKPLAYVLCWLGVAGGNSVLPSWVRLTFPKTRELIALLRDVPCTDPQCGWCQEQHNLLALLPRYFPGISEFRATPSTPEGHSLQQTIVENGFAGTPTLAILPTGGGKSLCYQLPALARFYHNSSLTVIISPLQSLMKDQVDNLEARGIQCAGYLNSLLTPLERNLVLEKLRLGDIGLIFVAPEQFRSSAFTKALTYREIGAWVFDEAHCLSKWGHDFRPDYLYVARFIKHQQKDNPSPVFCFTATAKPDVIHDIVRHFHKLLGISLSTITGGVSRDNLAYEVHAVPKQIRAAEVLRLLQESSAEAGSAIVFCALRDTVEELANLLQQAGVNCGFFHGGMLAEKKRHIQEAFIAGDLRVIVATNAFGMGVDKTDVRLVIHYDTPGSLENYLQEAGRAGRDQASARCVLLFDDADLDVQFRLLRNSQLTQHDIYAILKALRSIEKKDRSEGTVVVTSGEILLEIPEKLSIEPDAPDTDTKVRIAVAWLEEAKLLERQENHTRVFPGSLLVANLEDAKSVLQKNLPPNTAIEPYLSIIAQLFNCADDEGISTDDLMLGTGRDSHQIQQMLNELSHWGLVSNDTEIGVTLQRDPDSMQRIAELKKLEDALMANLREEAPDADQGQWQILHIRRLCDKMRRDTGVDLQPDKLARLLKSFAETFGTQHGQRGFFAIRPAGADHRSLKLLRNWQDIELIRDKRMQFGLALVSYFIRQRQGSQLLVTCKQGELLAALQADLTLQDLGIRDWNMALAAALIYLDANQVLHLARGKAIFRAAMSIKLNAEARRRQFKKSDYAELALHYKDKIIQVHVMAEYARLALGKIQAAMSFILDYFAMERSEFVQQYFAGRQEILELATTEAAHRRILIDLQNPTQQAIVATKMDASHLVLAGPGSGKTRVIVHRVAWLLRECMVLPDAIMVLSYNRSAAFEIRRRLRDLVGTDANGVRVQTLHSLAMQLTGTSYAIATELNETIEFPQVLNLATQLLLQQEQNDVVDTSIQRDRLLAGLRFLLVDEYQDINADHYALISAISGRMLHIEEDKLVLFAVGDDDQNIYAFDGANVRFIKQFSSDYQAHTHYLLENYRSTTHIIQSANRLIAPIRDRMKNRDSIRINYDRRDAPAGGEFSTLDPLVQGRVHILLTPPQFANEADVALQELIRLNRLENAGQLKYWGRFAIIARHWKALAPIAAACREHGIPVRLMREKVLADLVHTREGFALLRLLSPNFRSRHKPRIFLNCGALQRWFRHRFGQNINEVIEHPYRAMLAQFITECSLLSATSQLVASDVVEALYEFGSGTEAMANESIHAPMLLLTAHRAKGLEFDHVLILDAGGWQSPSDDERRLFYVAMTRARKTLTMCARQGEPHAFIQDCMALAFKSQAMPHHTNALQINNVWVAQPKHVHLSWPGYFGEHHPIHLAISGLEYATGLRLTPRSDGKEGWELQNLQGMVVTRMAKKFTPPAGTIIRVQVAAILVRHAKPEGDNRLKCIQWEIVLPEIIYA